jgi:hypothetical protein
LLPSTIARETLSSICVRGVNEENVCDQYQVTVRARSLRFLAGIVRDDTNYMLLLAFYYIRESPITSVLRSQVQKYISDGKVKHRGEQASTYREGFRECGIWELGCRCFGLRFGKIGGFVVGYIRQLTLL